ncbi:unnamed protein product [Orchesella dallaii]|uniref:Uncharacterized protein n=1 Tax=Orchesella dallaii TaxID=48710 RepID=A0ABP1R6U3_9HEXA
MAMFNISIFVISITTAVAFLELLDEKKSCLLKLLPELNSNWERGTYRYSIPQNIIISPLIDVNSMKTTIMTFVDAVPPSTSLFLFSRRANDFGDSYDILDQPVFPAVKVVLSLPAGSHLVKGTFEFSLWYEPFSYSVWITFLAILGLTFVCLWIETNLKLVFVQLLKLISSALGQESWKTNRYYIVAWGISYVCFLYESSVLSMVTVVPVPKTMQYLKPFINAGFKIAVVSQVSLNNSIKKFEFDFNMNGIENRINESFQVVLNVNTVLDMAPQMGRRKLAITEDTSSSDATLRELIHETKKKDPSVNCFKLVQTLAPRLETWKINTANRYWIVKTLQRLEQSGMVRRWDEWSSWRYLLFLRVLDDKEVLLKPDYINLPKIASILLLASGFILVSLLIFILEPLISKQIIVQFA